MQPIKCLQIVSGGGITPTVYDYLGVNYRHKLLRNLYLVSEAPLLLVLCLYYIAINLFGQLEPIFPHYPPAQVYHHLPVPFR